ncbi:MAG: TolC family protein [Desulfobacterales bacterium]|nr:TolC family protein [Desulfobacterales bacterium]
MNWLESVLDRRRLVLTLAVLMAVVGALLWMTMVRQEDPRLPDFWGQVIAPYPGADAVTVEKMVLDPVEDALAEVDEIKVIEASAYDEVAVLVVELRGDVADFDKAWDEVREALARARRDFPDGAGEPILDEDQQDQHSVVLAVTGSSDLLTLLKGARQVKDELLALSGVSKVELIADPGEQITIDLDDFTAQRLGIGAPFLAAQLSARNHILPGGSLVSGGKSLRLRPLSEFTSMEEIAATPVLLPSGGSVPLGETARVHLGPAEPARARMRFNGEMSVGLAVTPRESINLVHFGREVRARIAELAPGLAPLKLREVAFQPKRTETRLSDLNRSLMFGILIVAGVLVLAMGARMGLVVASVAPMVAMASLTIFAWGGGVLHQISIAALVLALGMLVDNAIVMAENVQWRLDRGDSPRRAALASVKELAAPLAGATATTLAAFVPMLISKGPTAAFTRSIPVVIMLTLVVSYVFAIFVTPVLSRIFFRPRKTAGDSFTGRVGGRLAALAVRRPGWVALAAVLMVTFSLNGARSVRLQFFPISDRNQFVVDLKLPEGSHLDATDNASRTMEKALLARANVASVASFMGRGAPKFYYNIPNVPYSPHFAQMIVQVVHREDIAGTLDWIRARARDDMPGVEVVARELAQGPPVAAPVEVRLFGRDLEALNNAAVMVTRELRMMPATRDVRHDLGPGAPTIRFEVDDAAAARRGLSRADIARAVYGRTRGLPIGELRAGDDPIPVVIRSSAGEHLPVSDLDAINVMTPDGGFIPLAQTTKTRVAWQPAAIHHRNGPRVVTASAQLAPGFSFSDALSDLKPRLAALDLPRGVRAGFGGDAEGSGEANANLLKTFPIGLLLLLAVLLAEFNSFRRVAIILFTVPLAAAGVIPGLLIGDQPFGFMSMLGVIALVGIVVNNAIVLMEVVEERRREGASVNEALEDAVKRRIRPILLTTVTTVAGLLPLAFSSSTLWPPLASAMISGLLGSTFLTLVAAPALYRILFARSGRKAGRVMAKKAAAPAAVLIAIVFFSALPARAEEPLGLTLHDAMIRGRGRPAHLAARERTAASERMAEAERRAAMLPVITYYASASARDRDLHTVTPIGKFPSGEKRTNAIGFQVVQPLLDPVRVFYTAPAARDEARGKALEADRIRQELSAEAGFAYLDVLGVDARMASAATLIKSLRANLDEINQMVAAGRALEADALKVNLFYEQAVLHRSELRQHRKVAVTSLARAVDHTGEAAPLTNPDMLDRPLPDLERVVDRAIKSRPDLTALETYAKALEKRRAGVWAEAIPRLDANCAFTHVDGSPYAESNWTEASLTLTWTPFASGVRAPRSAALRAERKAILADLTEARRGVRVEVEAAWTAIVNARDAFKVEERAVAQTAETLRVERERRLAGRSTTNDLLDAEAQHHGSLTRRELARLNATRAWIRLWLAAGEKEPLLVD